MWSREYRRIVEMFDPIQRHEALLREADAAHDNDQEPLVLLSTLTFVQRKIVQLLGLKPAA